MKEGSGGSEGSEESEGRTEGRKDGRKEERKEGRKGGSEGRKEERKDGRTQKLETTKRQFQKRHDRSTEAIAFVLTKIENYLSEIDS